MKKHFLMLALSFFAYSGIAQTAGDPGTYAATITKEDLKDYLSILASDALEGRETGERGQKMAAAFISNHFETLGLQGPVKTGTNAYLQKVPLFISKPGNIYVKANGKTLKNFEDMLYFGNGSTQGEQTTSLVFAGKGTEEAFKQVDVKDKAVLVTTDNWRNYRAIAELAREKGAKAVFMVASATAEEHQKMVDNYKGYLSGGSMTFDQGGKSNEVPKGVFFISPATAANLLATDIEKLRNVADDASGKKLKKIKAKPVSYQIERTSAPVNTENVLGYLEGTDKKDEVLVITAHYDHIGRNGEVINNGADDDGSGTSAVMELAEAFVKAKEEGKGPRRSILFMLVTGEEKGLLGSEYYAANPVYPLTSTIANLNIDMIGRVDPKHKDNPNYVYLVGADRLSSELHKISEETNAKTVKVDLDYTYNDETHPDRIYYRSDHWNFAKNNVPVIFYFNGTHEDYHKPSDTIDKIDFDALQKRAHLVFYTAWELANRDARPAVDKAKEEATKGK